MLDRRQELRLDRGHGLVEPEQVNPLADLELPGDLVLVEPDLAVALVEGLERVEGEGELANLCAGLRRLAHGQNSLTRAIAPTTAGKRSFRYFVT